MRLAYASAAVTAALLPTCACIGLHRAGSSPLQIHPSFDGKGIKLFPAHSPGHKVDDVVHLTPQMKHSLYYSQEGHRPALHGAKHATFEVNYIRPTVMLDHTGHVERVDCLDNNPTTVCFTSEEFKNVAKEAWKDGDFNLGTYHVGCGDEISGKRSYFHVAQPPAAHEDSRCLVLAAQSIDDHEAFHSGEIAWGTYMDPAYRKRTPAFGHVYMVDNDEEVDAASDGTIDIGTDLRSRKNFFQDGKLKSHTGDNDVKEFEFIGEDGKVTNKRGDVLFQGLFDSIVSFFNAVEAYLTAYVAVVSAVAAGISELGTIAAKAVGAVFGVPFDHAYRNDFSFQFYLKPLSLVNRPPELFGLEPGLTLKELGPGSLLQCAKCGLSGDFSISGRLAFTLAGGITNGQVALANSEPFRVDVQFGLTVKQSIKNEAKLASKQLGAVPLTPLTIPGIISLGPQATISAALELTADGRASLLFGGYFQFNKGQATLDVVDSNNTKLEGLEPQFVPVFNFTGSLTATAQFSVPLAIEVGLDVLNGKFKKAVSLVNKPSIYVKAIAPTDPGKACQDGIQLRAGVRNQLYFSPRKGEKGDEISNDILFEKGIACVTDSGFDVNNVSPDASIFGAVTSEFGNDIDAIKPDYVDDTRALQIAQSKVGFRLIMDDDKSSILVTGKDGFIYLASTDQKYDFSSPWGSVKQGSNIVDLDVLGRITSYIFSKRSVRAAQIKMFKPSKVPKGFHASGLVIAKGQNTKHYAVLLKSGKVTKLFYPTFCKTNTGFRLFATEFAFTKSGSPDVKKVKNQKAILQVKQGLQALGVTDTTTCRTVQLSGST